MAGVRAATNDAPPPDYTRQTTPCNPVEALGDIVRPKGSFARLDWILSIWSSAVCPV